MIYLGKDFDGKIFTGISKKVNNHNVNCHNEKTIIGLYDSFFTPTTNNNPFCAIIKKDKKLIIEDLKMCKDILDKFYFY